jgi:hypothetical protein
MDTHGKIALLSPPAGNRRPTRIGIAEARSRGKQARGNFSADSPMKEIWGRINLDIATFLGAMEALSLDDSDDNYQVLMEATDRLLWGSARTRLELERILDNYRKATVRRFSG